MLPKHSRPSIAHNCLHLFAAIPLVTMHRTIRAGGFFHTEATSVQPHAGVIEQSLTLWTQTAVVMIAAVDADHRFDGLPFARESLAGLAR